MSAKKNPFSHIRLVYRRSSPLLKCVVLTAIVLSVAALTIICMSIQNTKAVQDQMQAQINQLAQDNQRLTKQIAELGTVESVRRIATQELGLVNPNGQFFTPNTSPE